MSNRFVETIALVVDTAARDGFRVALIGGFALPFFGVVRATGDVDFLVDAAGAEAIHGALVAAGFAARHRTDNVANYAPPGPHLAPADFLFARRPATLAMLARARARNLSGVSPLLVSSVDAEGVIGLKVQAIANDPKRRRQDEADILALLRANKGVLDVGLIRAYFEAFEMSSDLERLLAEAHEA